MTQLINLFAVGDVLPAAAELLADNLGSITLLSAMIASVRIYDRTRTNSAKLSQETSERADARAVAAEARLADCQTRWAARESELMIEVERLHRIAYPPPPSSKETTE